MNFSLTRLLQLASPTLPVGAYTYSQGLEWAVEVGQVSDEGSAFTWIDDQLTLNLGRYEAPWLAQMMSAWQEIDSLARNNAVSTLNAEYLASRESAELRAETLQMGYSLRRLCVDLQELPETFNKTIESVAEPTFPLLWAGLAMHWHIEIEDALTAWLWSWAENQTLAAIKGVPLGQAAGQRILLVIGARIPDIVGQAISWDSAQFSNFAPGFAIACAHHETQYSRLFRS